jgi:hypothetical protein
MAIDILKADILIEGLFFLEIIFFLLLILINYFRIRANRFIASNIFFSNKRV